MANKDASTAIVRRGTLGVFKRGFGTASPGQTIHVRSSSNQIRLQDSSNDYKYDLDVDASKFSIADMNVGVNRLTIDSAGKVGMGTTVPDDKLHVVGNVFIEDSSPEITLETTSASHPNWQIGAQEWNSHSLQFASGSTDADASNDTFTPRLTIKSDGKVGIGAIPKSWNTLFDVLQIGYSGALAGRKSDNSNQVDIMNNVYYDGAFKRINVGYASRFTQNHSGDFEFWSAGTAAADSGISFSESMTILNNGYVGIGTGAPSTLLDVNGTANFAGNLTGTTATFSGNVTTGDLTTADDIYLNAANAWIISGRVGNLLTGGTLRIQSFAKLRVDGGLKIGEIANGNTRYTTSSHCNYLELDAASSGGGGIIWGKQSTSKQSAILSNHGKLEIGYSTATDNSAAWVPALTVNDVGNVGIGTTAPGYALDVPSGTVRGQQVFAKYGSNKLIQLTWGGTTSEGRLWIGNNDSPTILINGNSTSYINNGANFGIGTASPQRSLHVVGNYIRNDEATVPTYLLRETTNNREWGIRGRTERLEFMDHGNNAVFMSILHTNGNVGIGTTNPGSYKLNVEGQVRSAGHITISNNQSILTNDYQCNTNWRNMTFTGPSESAYHINLTGANVGINEASPDAKLHITGRPSYTTANLGEVSGLGFVRFQPSVTYEKSIWIHNAGNNVGFQGADNPTTDATVPLTLNAYGGKVGIGIVAPAVNFHLHSTSDEVWQYITTDAANKDVGIYMGLDYDGTANYSGIVFDQSEDALKLFNSNSIANHLVISNSGKVGVGKTPNSAVTLSVSAPASNTTNYGLEICNASANTRFLVDGVGNTSFYGSDNSLSARVTSDGKVGIGTTSPDFNLDVQGSGTPTLCVRNTSASADAMIHVGEPNTTAYGLQIKWSGTAGRVYFDNRYNDSTNPYMYFRMRTAGSAITALSLGPAGQAVFGNDVTVTGNLTVNGTATTIDTTNLLIEDPLMLLARTQSGTPTLDSGLIIERGDSTNVGMIWDESGDEFAFINTTDTATTAGNVSIASYAPLRTASLTASGALTIDGNISNAADEGIYYLNNAGTGNSGVYIRGLSGDTMRFHVPASKYIEWEIGGSHKMRLDASGNLGVGTNSPSSPLHVTADTANSNYLVYFYNSGSQALDHGLNTQIGSSSATAYGLRVNTGGNSNALAVMGDGKVGIGTNAPTKMLEVEGSEAEIRVHDTYSDTNNTLLSIGSDLHNTNTKDSWIKFLGGNATNDRSWAIGNRASGFFNFTYIGTRATLPSTGGGNVPMVLDGINNRVGIGTTAPGQKLTITEGSSTVSIGEYSNGAVIWLDGVNGDLSGGDYFHILADGNSALRFGYAAVAKVSMKNNGSVGIGTTNPATKLEIASGDVRLTDAHVIEWGGTKARIGGSNSGDFLKFYTDDTVRMYVKDNGYVGIGTTSPVAPIHTTLGAVANTTNKIIAYFGGGSSGNQYGSFIARVARDASTSNVGVTNNESYVDIEVNSGGSGPHRWGTYEDVNIVTGSHGGTSGAYGAINFVTGTGSNTKAVHMTIGGGTRGGKVGIGTTAPGERLHVNNGNFELTVPSYGGGTGGNLQIGTTTAKSGTYTNTKIFKKKFILHVTSPSGDPTQNEANSQAVLLQLPGRYAGAAAGGHGTIRITYMQSHYGGTASFEYKFSQLYGAGTQGAGNNNYTNHNYAHYKFQKVHQNLETASYFSQSQIDYVVSNLTFKRHRPSTSGYDSLSAGIIIKLPPSGTSRVRDIAIEVDFLGASDNEGAVKMTDLGLWANAPTSGDLSDVQMTELWLGDTGNGTITTPSTISVGGQILTPSGSNLALNPNTGLVTVGGALSTTGNVTVGGTLTENSSIAIKENIFNFTSPLEKISKVRPVKYNKKTNKDKKEIGLIAEELALIFPELVENDENGKPVSVNYTRAVTVLFDGFKQMYKELKEIKERIK